MEKTPGVSDSTQNASGSPETETRSQYEQDKHDGIAYDTYKKAISQYKRANDRVAELENALQSYEQDKMQSEGKKDEVIASLKKQLGELQEQHRKTNASYTWNVVGAQIKSELAARGVRNADKALNYAKAVHKDDLATIAVDDQYNVDSTDLGRFVDKFLMENQDMGFISKVGVRDIPPGRVEVDNNEQKPTDKLSDQELMAAWKAAQE